MLDTIILKLQSGDDLTSEEIEYLVENGKFVHEIDGKDYGWQKEVRTIVDIEGELFAIDWLQGIAEDSNEFGKQPYRVQAVEKQLTRIEYEEIL